MTIFSLSRLVLVTAFGVAVLCNSQARAANLIVNGGFELPALGGSFVTRGSGDDFGGNGWFVSSGNVDHVRTLWQHAEGNQSLDLNGSVGGSIVQDIPTIAGAPYKIRFAYAGNPAPDNKRFQVFWDSLQIADITFVQGTNDANNMGWLYAELTATAVDASTQLNFASLTGNMNGAVGFGPFYGPTLDDVSVELIPEPSAFAMATLGLIGLAAARRR